MEITEKNLPAMTVVSISGRLDAVTSGEAEKKIGQVLEKGQSKILISLSGLDYISSAGLRILLVAAKKARQHNITIALCDLNSKVREVFDLSGFSSIFTIFESEQAALEKL